MPTRKINFTIGEFYHIYNRGNNKQEIFHDAEDYERFRDLLLAVNQTEKFDFSNSKKGISVYELSIENPIVGIGAYTPMPNHFHILLTPLVGEGVSLFMKKLCIAYVMYFNEKYKRTGGLFEGRFKAKHLDSDRYLKYVFSYIHLNVQKLGINPFTYPYSSYMDYCGEIRLQNKVLNKKLFPEYFFTKDDFIKEMNSWIIYRDSGVPISRVRDK